jgi:hypothetical protein
MGTIVWRHGGLPAGSFPDLKLARERYTHAVGIGELTLADKGYRDGNFFVTPISDPDSAATQKKIMARHETINARLKAFRVLSTPFRHDIDLHETCFYAVANIVQLMILNGHPLFDVDN